MRQNKKPNTTTQRARQRPRSPAAIAASEEWLFTALQSIGDGVIATDAGGRVTFMNAVAEHLTGWGAEEAQGEPCGEIFRIISAYTRLEAESPVDKVLRDGVISGLANHTLLVSRDGTERSIDDSGSPIRNREDALIGVVLIFRDVTDRRTTERLLEEQNRILQTLFDHIPLLVAFLDGERRFRWVNREWERLTGWTLQDMQDRDMLGEFYGDAERGQDTVEFLQWASPGWRDVEKQTRDGRTLRVAWANIGLADGSSIGIGCDVTSRQDGEEERLQRQRDLDGLNSRLQWLTAESPPRAANNLQSISALLELQAMDHPQAVRQEHLNHLRLHLSGLAAMSDLLTAGGAVAPLSDRISLQESLRTLLPVLRQMLRADQIRCTVQEVSLPLRHGIALALVVNELVSNAVRHGGKSVDVNVNSAGAAVCVEVCDSGPGFPTEFDPRTSARSGLQLVETLSRWELGADTAYENRAGGGCVRVSFRVPA